MLAACAVIAFVVSSAACSGRNNDVDRATALKRIEARLAEDQAWNERYRPLAARRKAGENVATEIEAMRAARPGFAGLLEDAEHVLQSDPADDAAFKAIEVALRGNGMQDMSRWAGSVNEARQERMQRLLLSHHIRRPDFLRANYLHFVDPRPQVEFWKQVLERSPHASVRGYAARSVMKRYAEWSQEAGLDPQERDALRGQVRHYANLIKSEYADQRALVDDVSDYLAGFDSAGVKLPHAEVAKIGGGTDSLGNYRGKVVLLDFWATWCTTCRRDHPRLVALKQELHGRAFEIISVSADEKPEMVTRYLSKERELPWPQWYVGPDAVLLKDLGIQGYPTYLLVGGDGTVEARGSTRSLSDIMDRARKLVIQSESK